MDTGISLAANGRKPPQHLQNVDAAGRSGPLTDRAFYGTEESGHKTRR